MFKKIFPKEPFILLLSIWAIFIIDRALPLISLNNYGVRPRHLEGLVGVLTMPFLHANLGHIISNSIPLLILSVLIIWSYGIRCYWRTFIICMLLGGFATWAFSTGGMVVGASGVIYGLIGFLFTNAFFNPSLRSWLMAAVAFFLFGGSLLALTKFHPNISWAGHFWGFVAGVIAAKTTPAQKKKETD